jgi:hypothetical protein
MPLDILDSELENRVWRLRYNSDWTLRRIARHCGISLGKTHTILKSRKTRLVLGRAPKRTRLRDLPPSAFAGMYHLPTWEDEVEL